MNGFLALDQASGVNTFTVASNSTATYAIVTSIGDSAVQIIDVSNPSAIFATDAVWQHDEYSGDTFTQLYAPYGAAEIFTVASNSTATYAIVTDRGHDDGECASGGNCGGYGGVQIIDVSNPSAIFATDAARDGADGFTQLRGANAADIFTIGSKTYAIVTSLGQWDDGNNDAVQIIDISNPSAIVAKDTFAHANMQYPGGVETFTIGAKTYAAVAGNHANGGSGTTAATVQILDISDPTNIVAKDSLVNSGSLELNGAWYLDIFTVGSSTYAIVAGYDDDGVQIIDVSDPTTITAVDSLGHGGSVKLDSPYSVDTFTIGLTTYAIIPSTTYGSDNGSLQIIQLFTDEGFVEEISKALSESISFTDSITKSTTKTTLRNFVIHC